MDAGKFQQSIVNLKITLVQTSSSNTAEGALAARDILETLALFSVKTRDFPSFERHFTQLRMFYSDMPQLAPSENQWIITGLFLLYLLTCNRTAEFHSELELIPTQLHTDNIHIRYSLEIEQCISEASYRKMVEENTRLPHVLYNVFIADFLTTVRDKIASCCEKAYDTLKLESAQHLLMFTSAQQVVQFAEERGWQTSSEGVFDFKKTQTTEEVPSIQLITQTLAYARELETIV